MNIHEPGVQKAPRAVSCFVQAVNSVSPAWPCPGRESGLENEREAEWFLQFHSIEIKVGISVEPFAWRVGSGEVGLHSAPHEDAELRPRV